MIQNLIVYLAVAVAAVWVVWNVLLPRSLKATLKGGRATKPAPGDCACGKGDCKD